MTVTASGAALAADVDAVAYADACRQAGLSFLDGVADGWGKRDLAEWLLGAYRAVSMRPAPKLMLALEPDDSDGDAPARNAVDHRLRASAVEELLGLVRIAVCCSLSDLQRGDTNAVTQAIREGHVACAPGGGGLVWVPINRTRVRLESRITSLFVVDYLSRPEAYQRDLNVCAECDRVSFQPNVPCFHDAGPSIERVAEAACAAAAVHRMRT